MVFFTGGAFTPQARAFLDEVENPTIDKPLDVPSLTSMIDERLR